MQHLGNRFGPLLHQIDTDAMSGLEARLLVTSPYMGSIQSGGLFLLDFEPNECVQICQDDCRGMIRYGSGYLVATRLNGLIELDAEFHVIGRHPAPAFNLHGMRSHDDGRVLIAETGRNRIGILSPNRFERIGEVCISEGDADLNHVNDFAICGERLIVSMFALEGEWRQNLEADRWTGAIVEYDLVSGRREKVLYSGLHMPHTILLSEDSILFCESDEFRVRCEGSVLCQFNGYTRGLERYGPYLIVGQSRVKSFEKRRQSSMHVSLDAGIHIVDLETLLTRFVPIPTTQIYDILSIDEWTDKAKGDVVLKSLW